jgi:site-specific DNA recombinase
VDLPELRIIDQELWQAVQDRLEGVRQSARSRKIRKSEFWKNRRPKHLLTGLIHCAQCGNAMAAVGSDYLACSAARNGAGCNNTKGIKRTIIEHGVLEGLKTRLMAPDLVEEFVRAFHAEVNKQLAEDDAAHRHITQELQKISTKLDGLYNAIADGLRTKGLRTKLEQLEKQQSELQDKLTEVPPPQPRLHPNLAKLYRERVENLHAALSDPQSRTEAAEILRSLVEKITVKHDKNGVEVELVGDIVKLVSLPEGNNVPASFESSVKVVAGRGFEPLTFRL